MTITAGEIEADQRATTTISVVIPARNEARNIGWVLERLPEFVGEVVLVDGNSTDETVDVARRIRPDIVVVVEPSPGKGAALRAGFDKARGDVIVMIDADGSMDPREIDRFVEAIETGHDVAKGSRFADGGGSTDLTWFRTVGNRILLALVNKLYGSQFSELCYGFFAFHRTALPLLDLQADGFEIETEMVVKALQADLRIAEVPSIEATRRHGRSNLRPIRDGSRVLFTLLRTWTAQRRTVQVIDLTDSGPHGRVVDVRTEP